MGLFDRRKSPIDRLREREALRAAEWAHAADEAQQHVPVATPLSDAEAWAETGDWHSGFSSSNVRSIRYEAAEERLHVEYGKPGEPTSFYYYEGVPRSIAVGLYEAPSKGTYIWDHVRIRGTRLGHFYEYVFVSGVSARQPAWMATEESRRRHGGGSRPRKKGRRG